MYFGSFNEFVAMGGHGLYVWMSYGIFVVILVWNIWTIKSNRRQCLKDAQKTWNREQLNQNTPSSLVPEPDQ